MVKVVIRVCYRWRTARAMGSTCSTDKFEGKCKALVVPNTQRSLALPKSDVSDQNSYKHDTSHSVLYLTFC